MDIVAYTAVFGGYDTLEPARFPELCLTDGQVNTSAGWRYHTLYSGRDPKWANRQCKILVHEHVKDAEYSIYHDGNVTMHIDPAEAVARWLKDADMAVFAHPEDRDCAYQEAEEVVRQSKAKLATVDAQMARYHGDGFPAHYGLSACYVLIRRHTPEVREFCDLWWHEYEQGAKRDQLSFDYVRWKTGLKVATIPGNLFAGTCPYFKRTPHRRLETATVNWKTAYGKMLLPEEREYLMQMARETEARFGQAMMVNIGIFRYASMYCLRAGAPGAELVGVDIKYPDVEPGTGLRAVDIIGDSAKVHADFDKPIHLLFIDGDHHYAGVKADLENWTPKVVPGGLVICHDYGPRPEHLALNPALEGVRRAVMEWADGGGWERLQASGSLAAYRRRQEGIR